MHAVERTAQHRILALDATNKLQEAMGFDDKWKGLVENSIFLLIEDGYRRGAEYGHSAPSDQDNTGPYTIQGTQGRAS